MNSRVRQLICLHFSVTHPVLHPAWDNNGVPVGSPQNLSHVGKCRYVHKLYRWPEVQAYGHHYTVLWKILVLPLTKFWSTHNSGWGRDKCLMRLGSSCVPSEIQFSANIMHRSALRRFSTASCVRFLCHKFITLWIISDIYRHTDYLKLLRSAPDSTAETKNKHTAYRRC